MDGFLFVIERRITAELFEDVIHPRQSELWVCCLLPLPVCVELFAEFADASLQWGIVG